ncbi:glycosyltransferase family 2 protein [Paenibacillus doosanensis]|nr:glycosyltransferase family 2 protein [Paenibacillus doosanensis]
MPVAGPGNRKRGKPKAHPQPLRFQRTGKRRRRPFRPRIFSQAFQAGFRAGRKDAADYTVENEPNPIQALNRLWLRRANGVGRIGAGWRRYEEAAKGYVNGYFRGKRKPPRDWLMMPTGKSVAAIVTVMNEERTIGSVMSELKRLPLEEIYVIVNGSSDRSFEKAREHPSATVLFYPEPLGHDVGRAVGAKMAQSEILLFLDGDIQLSAERLLPFISAVDRGTDVALNDISPFLGLFYNRDQVTYMKQFLNVALGRNDLQANSMTAVPHALSRRAVETIGIASLMVPPKAQALAVHHGLQIRSACSVDVVRRNRVRNNNIGPMNHVAELIVGDHLEALKLIGDLKGERMAFADTMRKRSYAWR